MDLSENDRRYFDSLMELYKENEMISLIVSTFLHSVVIAHPLEDIQENDAEQTKASQGDKHTNETEETSSDQESDIDDQQSKKPVQVVSVDDDKQEYLKDTNNEQTVFQQVNYASSLPGNVSVDAMSFHSSASADPQESFEQKKHEDIDMKEFIKQVVHKKFRNAPELKFFDAAVVYDEKDYIEAVKFRQDILSVLQPAFRDELRIELFDSESFAQSKIMVVKDVIDRCSVVLLYLTSNFDSPELSLFVEESIAITRLGYNSLKSDSLNQQRQWVLKPVHTEPLNNRRYSVPMGLSSLKGINWYDKSAYTLHQIEAIFRQAIDERKDREARKSSDFVYEKTFGQKIETPFEKPGVPDFLTVTMPPEEPYKELLPGGFSSTSSFDNRAHYSKNVPLSGTFQQDFDYPLPSQRYTSRTDFGATNNPNYGLNFAHEYLQSPNDGAQRGFTAIEPTVLQGHYSVAGRFMPYATHVHRPDDVPHNVPLVGLNNESVPVHDTEPSLAEVYHQQQNYNQRQHDVTRPNQHYRDYTGSRNTPGEGFTNLPFDLLPSMSNLSTDDVEIDNYVDAAEQQAETNVTNNPRFHKRHRNLKPSSADIVEPDYADSENNDDSYDSDDDSKDSDGDSFYSDDEFDLFSKASKHNVINIQGCSIVQLGKGNLVTKSGSPTSLSTKKSTSKSKRKTNKLSRNGKSETDPRTVAVTEEDNSDTNINTKHTETHLNISPLELNIPNDEENILTENLIQDSNNLSENLLNYEQSLFVKSAERTKSKLNRVSLDLLNDSDCADSEEPEFHSPDCNISEDDLFASGPLESLIIRKNQRQFTDAPFVFSQNRNAVNILKNVPQTFTTATVNNKCDNACDSDLD